MVAVPFATMRAPSDALAIGAEPRERANSSREMSPFHPAQSFVESGFRQIAERPAHGAETMTEFDPDQQVCVRAKGTVLSIEQEGGSA